MSFPARTRARILASLGSLLLTLLAVEVGLRVQATRAEPGTMEDAWKRAGERAFVEGVEPRMIDLLRPSPHDRVIYELRGGLDSISFRGALVSTNPEGFVGPSRAPEPPPGTVRIVGIGDSIMFGWGVGVEASYLSILERELNERYPERSWEVVNMGVPGYNTTMEVESLRTRGLAYHPDVVILGLSANDLLLPHFIRAKKSHFSLRRSYLASLVSSLVGLPSGDAAEDQTMMRAHGKQTRATVPKEYRDMVGMGAFERAVDDLSELSRRSGFEVVSLDLWGGTGVLGKMAARCRDRGFVHASASELVEEAERGGATYLDLHLSEEDPHPSAQVHAFAARALFEAMVDGGTIDRLLGPSPD